MMFRYFKEFRLESENLSNMFFHSLSSAQGLFGWCSHGKKES
jgi:hypothetical protein